MISQQIRESPNRWTAKEFGYAGAEAELFLQFIGDPHNLNGGDAERHQVARGIDTGKAHDLFHDAGHGGDERIIGDGPFEILRHARPQGGKRSPIEFAIAGEGQLFDERKMCGNHVPGQVLFQMGAQRLGGKSLTLLRNDIGDEQVASITLEDNGGVRNLRMLGDCSLDLFEFNAVALYLDLEIFAPEKIDIPVRQVDDRPY